MAISIPTTLIDGAENTGTINAAVTIGDGGINSGAITGAAEILVGGVNTVDGTITGAVVVSGTNAGTIIGSVKVTDAGIMTAGATVTGTVLLEAGATSAAVVTGTLYVAAGATNTGSVASGGTLIATTIVEGVTTVTTNGFTFTGVAYNLEGDSLAYSYTAGVNIAAYTGSAFNLQADGLTHNYVEGADQGAVAAKYGYYTDGYYVSSVLTAAPTGAPQEALDALGFYYAYSTTTAEAGQPADGYFTNGYYDNAGFIASPDSNPHEASDNAGNYYTYSTVTAGAGTLADGYYTDGYYVSGVLTASPDGNPHEALNNTGHYYTYSTEAFGVGTLASGFYSNGYYVAGVLTAATNSDSHEALDNTGHYYYYNQTTGLATIASGYRVDGYYVAGVLTAASDSNPHEALDNPGVYYTYSTESGGIGSFFNGLAYNLQDDNKAYSYSAGVGSLITGYANLQGDGLYHYYAAGVDGGVKHQFTGPASKRGVGAVTVYWDNNPLATGDTLYASQTSGFTSVNLDYYTGTDGSAGYTHITTDESSAVATVSPVDHSYGSGSTWRDNSTPVEGDTIYTGRYTNATASNAGFYTGTEGVSGYTHVTTNGSGLVSTFTLVDHGYGGGSICYDNENLASGATVYTGQYTNATANNLDYYTGTEGVLGYTRITTNGSGVATVAPVSHGYGGGSICYDNENLASGATVYTGQYTNATANNLDYYTGTDGSAGYAHVTTNGSGVATVAPVNHSYGSGSIWYNNENLASGATVYTGQYTNATANNLAYYTGTDGMGGYTSVTTNGSGVATVAPVNHSNVVTFGSASRYTDIGSTTLYTGQYTNAQNTDASGLGSNMYYYNASSTPESGPYTQISATTLYSSCHGNAQADEVGMPISTGLNVGSIVRTAAGDIFNLGYYSGAAHFAFNGHLYTVNTTTGAITSIAVCDAYN